jgi:peptidoglycan-N-acetylglucosamine deacetylase
MNLSPINNKQLFSKLEATLPPPIHSIAAFGKFTDALCLTFDDGPDPVYTPAVLDILSAYNAKATFFVLGEAAAGFPQLVERILAEGHTLGNHTYSHPNPWFTAEEEARQEVVKTSDIIEQITGTRPRWFRPPYGRLRFAMRQQATLDNMTTVLWNRSVIDWGWMGNASGIRNRMERIEAGDIVLMHDGQRDHNRPDNLLRFLPGFLASLPGRSLQACSLDQLCNAQAVN